MEGVITALATPFDDQSKVDYDAFCMLIERQILLGIKNILILGSTGECESITREERTKLIKLAKRHMPSYAKLIVGTGAPDTKRAVAETKHAKDSGADACLVVTPYYSKCTQEGIFKHYLEISKVDVPIIVYNVPSRTNVNIEVQTLKKISTLKNIVALKEASTDISHILDVFHENVLPVFCGNDNLSGVFYGLGAVGTISVTSNVYPKAIMEMYSSEKKRKYILNKFYDFNILMFCEPNPIPVKYALSHLGIIKNNLRLPLTPLSEKFTKKISDCMESLKEFL